MYELPDLYSYIECCLIHIVILFSLELWEAPHLEQLLASSNEISFISPSILQCQSLHTLILDSNRLTELPVQVTRLLNLKRLSVCGNKLTALPNGRFITKVTTCHP